MRHKVTLELMPDTYRELLALSHALGYPVEATAEYAIRLVNACVREGLLEGALADAWPQEAQLLTGTGGKVIDFAPVRKKTKGE